MSLYVTRKIVCLFTKPPVPYNNIFQRALKLCNIFIRPVRLKLYEYYKLLKVSRILMIAVLIKLLNIYLICLTKHVCMSKKMDRNCNE